MARDPALEDRLHAAPAGVESLAWMPMMGGFWVTPNGHMLSAADRPRGGGARLMVRIGRDAATEAVAGGQAAAVEVGSRCIAAFVRIPAAAGDDAALRAWLARARAHVATLPPKD